MTPGRLLRTTLAAAVAAVTAGALAVACGSAPPRRLHAAGTPNDDGGGLLARASVRLMTETDEFTPRPAGGDAYAGWDPYAYGGNPGFTYGGFVDGGAYGGSIYANYQPIVEYGAAVRVPEYQVVSVTDGGAIEGAVTWPRAPRRPATLALAGCGEVDNTSVIVGPGGAVQGAVVYLETLASGRAFPSNPNTGRPLAIGGAVEARGCALSPRVQVQAPVPGALVLSSAHDVPVTLVVAPPGADAPTTHRLDAGGSRSVGLRAVGVTRVSEQDGRLAPAWVVSARHPYYAVTDARGRFRLDDVVPGEYTLVVWHPPVVTGVVDGVVQHGEPVVVTRKVVVKKTAASRVAIELP